MNKETRDALNEFRCGDNPTTQEVVQEVWTDEDYVKEAQDELIEEYERAWYDENFPLVK